MKGIPLAVLAVVVLNACAMASGSNMEVLSATDGSAEVRVLAQARWDALLRGDVTAAYGYLSPPSRAAVSLVQYQRRIRAGFWKRAVVGAVSCEPEVCKVNVDISYDYQLVKDVKTSLSESWVKKDGKWWFVLKK